MLVVNLLRVQHVGAGLLRRSKLPPFQLSERRVSRRSRKRRKGSACWIRLRAGLRFKGSGLELGLATAWESSSALELASATV
jgi:hypothetical protein